MFCVDQIVKVVQILDEFDVYQKYIGRQGAIMGIVPLHPEMLEPAIALVEFGGHAEMFLLDELEEASVSD